MVGDASFDRIYCSHALEHLYQDDVAVALKEFYRVLVPGGAVIIFVPDLEGVKPTNDVLYESPAGPISGLDLLYGYRKFLPTMPYMAHHTGFISETLTAAFQAAGFTKIATQRCQTWNLMGVAVRPEHEGQ